MTFQAPVVENARRHLLDVRGGEFMNGGFDARKFAENFDVLASADGGLKRLRDLVLDLAVRGKLTGCESAPSDQRKSAGVDAAQLPAAWRLLPLTDVFEAISTQGKKVATADVKESGKYPVVDQGQILIRGYVDDPDALIRAAKAVVVFGDHTRMVKFVDFAFVPGADGTKILMPLDLVEPRFFYWVLKSYRVASRGYGRHYATLLSNAFPLPPLAEQKRIVARVDQLMALIDDLEARQTTKREVSARFTKASLEALTTADGPEEFDVAWKRVEEHLPLAVERAGDVEHLRDAICGLAIAGWLSAQPRRADWGSGHDLVQAIIASRGAERRRHIEHGARPNSLPREERTVLEAQAIEWFIPPSWTVCGLDDLLACIPNAIKAGPFGSALTKSMYVSRGYKVYGQEQVINGDARIGNYYVDDRKYESLKSCAVSPGDLLISLMGTVGKVLILPNGSEPGIINPRLVKVTLDGRVFAPFLKLYLGSPQCRSLIAASARGVAMDGLNLAILRALPIPIPPFEEQVWLVTKVAQLTQLSNELEAKLRRAEDRASKFLAAFMQEMVT